MKKVFSLFLILISVGAFAQSNTIKCLENFKGNDDFHFLRFDYLGVGSNNFRLLKTKVGVEQISNIDNYKIIFNHSENTPSLYVKVEVSDSASFNLDKDVILDNYQLMVESTKHVSKKLDTLNIKGYNFYGYTKTEIDSAVSIASYVYFTNTNEAIYFNFMNRAGNILLYYKISDFITQRNLLLNNFVELFNKCN